MTLTRRDLLVGAAGGVLSVGAAGVAVEEGWLPGRAHDPTYWTRMLPAQLAFVGRALGSGA